jgi:hypothetical protein
MDGYQEKTSSVKVPKNTGVDGFLKTLRNILMLPRVQSIRIDAKGTVNYSRYVRDGETEGSLQIDYGELEPWALMRNSHIEELNYREGMPASNVIAVMFNRVARDGLVPNGFATGAETYLWDWHRRTAGIDLVRTSSVYGLPIYTDRQIPDHSLVLCAGYIKGGLVDCHRFIKVSMEADMSPPETTVSIL